MSFENISGCSFFIKMSIVGLNCLLLILIFYQADLKEKLFLLKEVKQKNNVFVKTDRPVVLMSNKFSISKDTIARLILDSGIKLYSISVLPVIQKDFASITPVKINVTGAHQQIENFLQKINKKYSFAVIHNFELVQDNFGADDALKMMGTIHDQQKFFALIAAGDGKIFRVAQGEMVGNLPFKVLEISNDQVQIKEISNKYQITMLWWFYLYKE